jgi:hypothetical protein
MKATSQLIKEANELMKKSRISCISKKELDRIKSIIK